MRLCLLLMNLQKDIEMKSLKQLMVALLTVAVVGSASQPKTITETKIIKVKVNPVYLEPCAVTPLFSKEVYLNSTEAEREELYVDYIVNLHKDLGLCNMKLLDIKKGMEND